MALDSAWLHPCLLPLKIQARYRGSMRVELPDVLRHRLLFALPREDRDRLVEWSEMVHLYRGDTVHEPGQLIEYIYFPLSAVFSLFGITVEGESVELCQVGREGIVGLSSAFPSSDIYQHEMLRTDVNVSGTALRISAGEVIEAFHEPGPFLDGLRRYLDILFSNLVTGATCNRHHSLEQRCARWMLSMQDRTATTEIQVTQENLSEILGVRRQTIDILLGTLSGERVIESARGRLTVRDRKCLEAKACECYWNARRRFDQFLNEISAL